MTVYINYLLEANLCLVVLYASYWLLFRNESNFGLRRMFLVSIILATAVLPLLSINVASHDFSRLTPVSSFVMLPELHVGQNGMSAETSATFPWWVLISIIYLAGIAIQMTRFLFKLWKLYRFVRRATPVSLNGQYIVRSVKDDIPAMSFFRYIILGDSTSFSDQEKKVMIRHEMVHARKWHSADILLMELLRIVVWFNPVVYAMRRELSCVHEFQADHELSSEVDPDWYCHLLAKVSLAASGVALVNHFHSFLTLKRIKMINTMKRKISSWKWAASVPVVVLVFIAVACHDHVMNDHALADATAIVQNSTQPVEVPETLRARFEAMQAAEPGAKFLLLELNEKGHAQLDHMQQKYGLPNFIQVFREGDETESTSGTQGKMGSKTEDTAADNVRTFAIVRYNSHVESVLDNAASPEDVYTLVEETARPEGSMEEYYAQLIARIKYPKEAKAKGISGKVFVEFVVEKDGSLSNFEVKKGIGHGCDEAAIRALTSSPAWIPARHHGEVVKQKMVLPVVFAENTRSEDILKNQ